MKVLLSVIVLMIIFSVIILVLLANKSTFDVSKLNDKNKLCLPRGNDDPQRYNTYFSSRESLKKLKTDLDNLKKQEIKLLKKNVKPLNDALDETSQIDKKLSNINYCSDWCSSKDTAGWEGRNYRCTCFAGYGDKNDITINNGFVTCNENPQNKDAISLTKDVDKVGNEYTSFIQDIKVYP